MFVGLAEPLPGAARRASRAALRRACSPSLKDPRDWLDDQMPPPKPGTPFSFVGRLPKVVADGQGLSSSDEANASESGVARRIVKFQCWNLYSRWLVLFWKDVVSQMVTKEVYKNKS